MHSSGSATAYRVAKSSHNPTVMQAWGDSPTVTRPSSSKVHPSRYSVSTPQSSRLPPDASPKESTAQLACFSTNVPKRQITKIDILSTIVLLPIIATYAPNFSLLSVNKACKKNFSAALTHIIYHKLFASTVPLLLGDQPDYAAINSQIMKVILPYLKSQDYTLRMIKQTTPFGIFLPQPRDLHLFIDCSSEYSKQRKAEGDCFSTSAERQIVVANASEMDVNIYRRIGCFLSMPSEDGNQNVKDIFNQPATIEELLKKDPSYLNRLFRYIFDQIYCSKQAGAYLELLYPMVDSLLEHHANNLSYEVLHYALLIHIHIILLYANPDKSKLRLDSMLEKIKLAAGLANELSALEQQLQTLFTQQQQAVQKIDKSSHLMTEQAAKHEKILQEVGKIIKKHFTSFSVKIPSSPSESSCCVIS